MALKRAVPEGRMPSLENLSIRHISLRGFGEHLVNTIQQPTIKVVDLVNTNLGSEDGKHFVERIDEGKLNHVETLTLLKNPELWSISSRLKPACYNDINLEMDLPQTSGPQFDFSTIGNLVSTFLNSVTQPKPEEQIEDCRQNVGLSHGEPKSTEYVNDLDLD